MASFIGSTIISALSQNITNGASVLGTNSTSNFLPLFAGAPVTTPFNAAAVCRTSETIAIPANLVYRMYSQMLRRPTLGEVRLFQIPISTRSPLMVCHFMEVYIILAHFITQELFVLMI